MIGIAASGTTPSPSASLRAASAAGAVTIAVANNPRRAALRGGAPRILVETGTEVIAGSTRMKAGTAQKIVLNLLSTAIMVKLGRVYRGLMVHMRARNAKLRGAPRSWSLGSSAAPRRTRRAWSNAAVATSRLAVLLGFGLTEAKAAEVLQAA